ncbi:MAG: LacI family DNA-binding transcriptional regulator [Capsulimonadaceae bacterium]|nr:LacI family DNA-binding transcriptional regulator [Capsulimonadaceae bacterium]
MTTTLRDIAKRAGVATGTVSHVLNNNQAVRISPETRHRVAQIATEMGYRPNRLAQSLVRQKTQTIGLLISGLRNPFFVEVLETAEEAALRRGYTVALDTACQLRRDIAQGSRLDGWPVDGILQWTRGDYLVSSYIGLGNRDVPVVYMGDIREDDCDYVTFDLYDGTTQALRHLYAGGRRRIAFMGVANEEERAGDPRFSAYLDFCAASGMQPANLSSIYGQTVRFTTQAGMREAGYHTAIRMAIEITGTLPDAVVCLNDLVAIGAYNGLRRSGVAVPDDIAIVGFDGIPETRVLEKPLTTVRSPVPILIERSLSILTGRLAGGTVGKCQEIIPCELIIGETS